MTRLYEKENPKLSFIRVDFNTGGDASDILCSQSGIDIENDTVKENSLLHKYVKERTWAVVVISDAQQHYHNEDFWTDLVRYSCFLPVTVRFILCATRSLATTTENLIDLSHYKLPGSLLFTEREALELINLPYPTGLHAALNTATIRDVLIRECGGIVGVLRVSITAINNYFNENPQAQESDILLYYFSRNVTQLFMRCFLEMPTMIAPSHVKLLVQMFSQPVRVPLDLADDVMALFRGIVVSREIGQVQYSCPAAMRYVALALFPNRSSKEPASLFDVMCAAIRHMSASTLRAAGVVGQSSPDAARVSLFQHTFLSELYAETPISYAFLPELSLSFGGEKMNGEVDYFILKGTHGWGLEFHTHGQDREGHVSRFSKNGLYAQLNCQDYLVVDFSIGEKRSHTAQDAEHSMSVYFKDDYANAHIHLNGVDHGIINLRP